MPAVRQPIRVQPAPDRSLEESLLSNANTRRLALNIPLIVLWVAAVAVAALGYFLLQSGNAAQADFYNTQGSDYLQFLNLQTQSTIGGMLLTAGVVGVFIALATHARNRAAAIIATSAVETVDIEFNDLEDEFDGTYGAAAERQPEVVEPAADTDAEAETTTPEPEAAPAEPAEPAEPKADADADEPQSSPARG